MAKSPLILAALAKDAVPELNFNDAKKLSSGLSGAFDSAILTTVDGEHLVVKVPATAAAGTEQEVELQALKALEGVRESLPFSLTRLVGETRDDKGSRVFVFEFLYGSPVEVTTIAPEGHLAESVGKAIAAIHNIPVATVEEAHLPSFDAASLVRSRIAELDRAAATGKIPTVLLQRWQDALEDADLFRYLPTVVHGALSSETVLEQDQEVSGVLAWSSLKISDPAEDFAWIFGANAVELNDAVMLAYSIERRLSDQTIRQRATLYSELEMARWMLHGVTKNDPDIIEDAAVMLEQLAAEVTEGIARPLIASAAAAIALENLVQEDAFIPAAVERILEGEPAGNQASAENDVDDESEELALAKTQAIEIVSVDATEEIAIVAEDGTAEISEVDTKTRVIELPEKSDNELF
jgi:aminoglycoside phosphotransferase (APT) family kinase protein